MSEWDLKERQPMTWAVLRNPASFHLAMAAFFKVYGFRDIGSKTDVWYNGIRDMSENGVLAIEVGPGKSPTSMTFTVWAGTRDCPRALLASQPLLVEFDSKQPRLGVVSLRQFVDQFPLEWLEEIITRHQSL